MFCYVNYTSISVRLNCIVRVCVRSIRKKILKKISFVPNPFYTTVSVSQHFQNGVSDSNPTGHCTLVTYPLPNSDQKPFLFSVAFASLVSWFVCREKKCGEFLSLLGNKDMKRGIEMSKFYVMCSESHTEKELQTYLLILSLSSFNEILSFSEKRKMSSRVYDACIVYCTIHISVSL